MNVRTDLAIEEQELFSKAKKKRPDGVSLETWEEQGIRLTGVRIEDARGAAALRKPAGMYVTLEMTRDQIRTGADVCAAVLSGVLGKMLGGVQSALVVGLGNAAITPDAVGPRTAHHVLATRHLLASMPELFGGAFRCVSVVAAGVLGTTGVESAELVQAVVRRIKPDCVIAVDALAAGKPERLCRSIQVSDAGIVPGSGIRNDRAALDRAALGVPVYALGIPTVCDLRSLTDCAAGMIVTPGDIDLQVADLARIAALGINRAMHPEIDPRDLAEFVS